MSTWKFTDQSNRVVFRTEPNGFTESQLASNLSASELALVLPADPVPNPRIGEIKEELAAIDQKRIRPLAEGDSAFLKTLNDQAIMLRAELGTL